MSAIDSLHLSPKTEEKLTLTDKERIDYIRKYRWIGYTRAQEITRKLEDLLSHPKQPRMPNLLLVGETNNGKTLLIENFRQRYPASENAAGNAISVPVLYVQAPPGPDERGLYNAILNRLFEKLKPTESTDQKRERVVGILKSIDLGILVIDEIHHLLAGPLLKQRNFLNVIKYLSNELCVPIVGIGTSDALRAIQIDPQLQNRFTPEVLPRWQLNAEFARLLASFESLLPLKRQSNLASRDMASRLLSLSGGTIGELSTLINEAAIYAIRTGNETIDATALANCGYRPPSERKAASARL